MNRAGRPIGGEEPGPQKAAMTNATNATAIPEIPIDLSRLAGWMDDRRIGTGPIFEATQLSGGTQNVLLRFRRAERTLILRHPPLNPRAESNRTMQREARVLAALAGTDIPHPALVASCDDPAVLGAAFYLMEEVPGFNPTVGLPERVRSSPSIRHRMGLALIDALAALAAVDPDAVGLSDFGRMDGFLERQAGRWAAYLADCNRHQGWSGPGELGDIDGVRVWLEANCPSGAQAGIIHGDYHIGNMLYLEDGTLTAVVDWEMATLGDPLMDLGRLLATWPSNDGPQPVAMRVERLDGFPTRDELVAHYRNVTQRDLSELGWFEVLGCYKLGIIFEGTYARAQSGQADMNTGLRLHAAAKGLLQRARDGIARL